MDSYIMCPRAGRQYLVMRGQTGDAPPGWVVLTLPGRECVSGTFRRITEAFDHVREIAWRDVPE